MKKEMLENTKFIEKPAIEFAEAFNIYTSLEKTLKIYEDLGVKQEQRVEELLMILDGNLTLFVKNEIETLNNIEVISSILVAYVSDFNEVYSADDLITAMNVSSLTLFMNYVGGFFISSFAKKSTKDWDFVKHDIADMSNYIKELQDVEDCLKDQVLELFNAPEETKMRFMHIVKSFYKAYRPFEGEILEKSKAKRLKYIEIFNENPQKFMEKYSYNFFPNDGEVWEYKVNIYVSYIVQIGILFSSISDFKSEYGLMIIGSNMGEYIEGKAMRTSMDKFLKLIADPNRYKILMLLSKKPWYIQALSKELNITPTTTHHHMQGFLALELLNIEKEDNKVLYTVDKDKVKKYLDCLSDSIFN